MTLLTPQGRLVYLATGLAILSALLAFPTALSKLFYGTLGIAIASSILSFAALLRDSKSRILDKELFCITWLGLIISVLVIASGVSWLLIIIPQAR